MKQFIFFLLMGLLSLAAALPALQDLAQVTHVSNISNHHHVSNDMDISNFQQPAIPELSQIGVRKRGVSYNDPNFPRYFKDDARSKVYWMYNWWSNPGGNTNTWFEFIPMLWSDHPEHTGRWFDAVEACSSFGGSLIHVFGFNEPDGCGNGGACMTDVQATVNAHKKWMEPLRNYGKRIEIISPAVTNGYRNPQGGLMGLDYLKEFLRLCNGCQIDYVAIHWYDSWNNVEYFKQHVRRAYEISGKYVWITEFAPTDGNEGQKIDFLLKVLPWLDAQPWVYRYSYQWAAQGSLVNAQGNGLSALGWAYVTL